MQIQRSTLSWGDIFIGRDKREGERERGITGGKGDTKGEDEGVKG